MVGKHGRHLVFEGIDRSGKSTISAMVAEWLKSNNVDVIYRHHPGSTDIGKELRKIAKESNSNIDENTEALIMAADNSAFISQILEPALKSGAWVISDRNNFISSLAYQTASGCSFEQLDKIHAATSSNPPPIDLLLIFRVSPETYAARAKTRPAVSKDNFENRGNSYTNKVMMAYDNMLSKQTERMLKFVRQADTDNLNIKLPQCLYIDANKPVEDVYNDCRRAVCSLIPELWSTIPDAKYGRPNN